VKYPPSHDPAVVEKTFEKFEEVNRESGVAVLIVEQKVREVLGTCKWVYSFKSGTVSFQGSAGGIAGQQAEAAGAFCGGCGTV
jgi:ABC-type branched-subunit amino acid transport system ATPase component